MAVKSPPFPVSVVETTSPPTAAVPYSPIRTVKVWSCREVFCENGNHGIFHHRADGKGWHGIVIRRNIRTDNRCSFRFTRGGTGCFRNCLLINQGESASNRCGCRAGCMCEGSTATVWCSSCGTSYRHSIRLRLPTAGQYRYCPSSWLEY